MNGRGVACFDYDRDGDIDVVVAQNSGPAIFYENMHSAPDGANFIALRLVSVAPNTQAIGALVTVDAGGQTQLRQVSANGSFQGQDGAELHFGLGTAISIDSITVNWPDGATTVYGAMPANRLLTLMDPAMLPYPDPSRQNRIEFAIASALNHVANPMAQDTDLLLSLAGMERMHGLSLPFSPGDEVIARAEAAEASGDAALATQLRAWRRLFDPLHQISPAEYGQLSGLDAITFAAIYCHQFPLDDSDVLALADHVSQGGYATTHALLALLWAIDNDCPMPPSYDSGLLSGAVGRVYDIAASQSGLLTDLRIEAMALLAAVGRHDLIQSSWVDQLLDAQHPNGGWREFPGDLDTLDHTTALALWLLLQLAEDRKVLSGFVAQPWDP
jgi:hypothetical protein